MSAFQATAALIPQLIAQHGRWQANKPALSDGDRTLTWAQFDRETNRVANGLATLGLEPGARVAVLMANSIEMALMMFGAGKAGVSVVPLNVAVADAAVSAMILDSGATAIAASGDYCLRIDQLIASGALPATVQRLAVVAPDASWRDLPAWLAAQSAEPPSVQLRPDTECNIIYSSGTTGQPKGIVHDHRCRLQWATDMALALRYHSACVTVCSLGLFSNISWVAMLATILVGGTMVIMPNFSPDKLGATVRRERVTHGAFVPVQLARVLESSGFSGADYASLQTIMSCGSPLAPAIKRAVRDSLGCDLIELYGLTEGLVTTLAPEDMEAKIESVGRPIPGQRLTIIDADDREVAPGESGEIVGAGPLVMTGYHRRPEATLEATWHGPNGERWLRTGDIGRIDADGFLYVVDRKKDMILSGGQNIYPADIEAVMLQHDAVADVAVIGVPSEKWGETPLAVVVVRPHAALEDQVLIDWTNARVGRQQRISDVRIVAELPRNPNGKILKRELRRLYALEA
ncbi:MAG: AMP-binding protein [Steroidobacteraceae bacterium]|nr:AMP-binding protein [Steroidobacteraceae bacterium]